MLVVNKIDHYFGLACRRFGYKSTRRFGSVMEKNHVGLWPFDMSPFWICRRFGCVAVLACRRFGCVAVLVVADLDVSPFWLSPVWMCRRFGVSPIWMCRRFGCRRFGCRRFGRVAVLACRRFGCVAVLACRRFGCVAVLVVASLDVSPFWLSPFWICRRFDPYPSGQTTFLYTSICQWKTCLLK